MSKFLFVLSRGTEDPTRVTRCFFLAKVAAEKGHDVTIFLLDDAVYLSNPAIAEHIKAPTGDALSSYLKFIREKNIPVLVCKPCAETRLISEDDLPPNFKISTGPVLIDLAAESKVFTF